MPHANQCTASGRCLLAGWTVQAAGTPTTLGPWASHGPEEGKSIGPPPPLRRQGGVRERGVQG